MKAFEASRAFREFSPPQYGWGRLFFLKWFPGEGLSEPVMEVPAVLGYFWRKDQQVLNPTPLNPAPATCHKRKRKLRCNFRKVALQKLHCNIWFSAVRTSFWAKTALPQAKGLHCNIEKNALQESGAFLPLFCGFQAPTFRHPRLGPAEKGLFGELRRICLCLWFFCHS